MAKRNQIPVTELEPGYLIAAISHTWDTIKDTVMTTIDRYRPPSMAARLASVATFLAAWSVACVALWEALT